MTDQIAAQKSVNTLLSGPAGGVLAAEFLSKITDYHNIITGDLGGTSFDVGIVQNGSIGITGEGVISGKIPTYRYYYDWSRRRLYSMAGCWRSASGWSSQCRSSTGTGLL